MTILENNNKRISITFGETVIEKDDASKDVVYAVTAPKVVCNNEEDATYIKNEVNTFINTLVRNLINKE